MNSIRSCLVLEVKNFAWNMKKATVTATYGQKDFVGELLHFIFKAVVNCSIHAKTFRWDITRKLTLELMGGRGVNLS